MQLSNSFTRQWLGLDKRVSTLMVVLCIISIGLLAYKVTADVPCREVAVAMSSQTNQKTNSFFTNELIHFSAPLEGDEQVEWDFGDKSTKLSGGHVTHMFRNAGDFTISVEVNGRCKSTQLISIKNFVPMANSDGSSTIDLVRELTNPIQAESFIIEQGKQILFSSNVQATSYQWSVEGDKTLPVKNTDKAAYTFINTGNFTLKLTLNDDPENSWTRVISVTPRKVPNMPAPIVSPSSSGGGQAAGGAVPPPPMPLPKPKPVTPEPEPYRPSTPTTTPITERVVEKVVTPVGPKVVEVYMDNDQWKEMLQDVVNGGASLGDFKMYLNDTETKMILVDKETISFAELVSRLKDKKVDDKSIQVDQDYDFPSKRLKKLIVKFKKKRGLF